MSAAEDRSPEVPESVRRAVAALLGSIPEGGEADELAA